jgi:hypothetical protein
VGTDRGEEVGIGADAERLFQRRRGAGAEVGSAVEDAEQRRRVEAVAAERGEDSERRSHRVDRADRVAAHLDRVRGREGAHLADDAQPAPGGGGTSHRRPAPAAELKPLRKAPSTALAMPVSVPGTGFSSAVS